MEKLLKSTNGCDRGALSNPVFLYDKNKHDQLVTHKLSKNALKEVTISHKKYAFWSDQFSMASRKLLAKRLPTTIFSQLTVRVALRLERPTFKVTRTKFLPADVRPANFKWRVSSSSLSPSGSVMGTCATLAVSNIRDFRLD